MQHHKSLMEAHYGRDLQRSFLIEAYLAENTDLPSQLLMEKKGDFKNILVDAGQAALSSGAIVATGGAGGDVVVDVIFATKIAKDVIDEVTSILDSAGEIGTIIKEAAALDFDGSLSFKDDVTDIMEKVVKNRFLGDKSKEMMQKASEKINEIISKIARAVGKWVGTLIPDDFGLGGPAFEALFAAALKKAGANAYPIALAGIKALPMGAGKYLTDADALEDLLESIATAMIDFIDSTTEWAESQREELESESFGDTVRRKASAAGDAMGAIAKSYGSAVGSGIVKQAKLQAAPLGALYGFLNNLSDGGLEAKNDQARRALMNSLRNRGMDDRIVSKIDKFYEKTGSPLKIQNALDQLDTKSQEQFQSGIDDYIESVKKSNKGEILFMTEKALPAVKGFLEKFRMDWIPATVAVLRKLMSWLMASVVIFGELVDPSDYLEMETKKSAFQKGESRTAKEFENMFADISLENSYRGDIMKITKREVKQLVAERLTIDRVEANIMDMGRRPQGVDLDTLDAMYGSQAFDIIDLLIEDGVGVLDEEEGIFYTYGSKGVDLMMQRRGLSEAFDSRGLSEYGLYEKSGYLEAEAEFDELMDEVAMFMGDARKRLSALMEKHVSLGATDTESIELINAAFEDAKSGVR